MVVLDPSKVELRCSAGDEEWCELVRLDRAPPIRERTTVRESLLRRRYGVVKPRSVEERRMDLRVRSAE